MRSARPRPPSARSATRCRGWRAARSGSGWGSTRASPALDPPNYIGMDVHRAARIMAAAHGGQVVLSPTTVALLDPEAAALQTSVSTGSKTSPPHPPPPTRIPRAPHEFPPLKTLYRSNLPGPRHPSSAAKRARRRRRAARPLRHPPAHPYRPRRHRQDSACPPSRPPKPPTTTPTASPGSPSHHSATHSSSCRRSRRRFGSANNPARGSTRPWRTPCPPRPLLLVDNVEHLLPGSRPTLRPSWGLPDAHAAADRSRERLQLTAETGWPVSPLSPAEGEQLFLDRAHAAGVDLAPDDTVRALCRRLDELPLADRARRGAYCRSSRPHQLLERLAQRLDLFQGARDSDPHQLTLRATVDWSYRLLDRGAAVPPSLSVFTGGCTSLRPNTSCARASTRFSR